MTDKPLILIVEDDQTISKFVSTMLSSNGYDSVCAGTGKEALSLAASHVPDLVLLDLGLPDADGIEVLQALRQWSATPVIVVSARGRERDKVEALDLGADDYITKPFGNSELMARIRTALRHSFVKSEMDRTRSALFAVGELNIDYEKRTVKLGSEVVHFTPTEYKILILLSRHAGKVLTHDFIMREIWGPNINENQALRANMANIRRKLEKNPAQPRYILTEVGVGYRMVEEV